MRYKGLIRDLSVLAVTVLCAGCFSGCSRFAAPATKLKPSVYNVDGVLSRTGQYSIGVRDELEIMVWKCPELNAKSVVRAADGMVSVPLIGDVKAQGLTPQELAGSIGEKMAYYVKEPRVAVRVSKFGEKKVFVLGEVMRPGAYRLERGDRILDLLANSGGFTDSALQQAVYVIRGGYFDSRTIRVNLGRLVHKGDMTQNIFLEEGDLVYIPVQEIENLNYALRKIFPSMYFAERLGELQQNIMTGQYDWHAVWMKMSGKGVWKD